MADELRCRAGCVFSSALVVLGVLVLLSCTNSGTWDQVEADLAALDWGYELPLFIDNSGVATTERGVVALARLTPANFPYHKLEKGGADIGFFARNGEALPYEVETWNPGGESRLWVRIPEIAPAGVDSRIWLRFGSRGKVGRRDSNATWDGSFAGVWHITPGEAAFGVLSDSSGGGNPLINGFGSNTSYGTAAGILGAPDGAVAWTADTNALVAAGGDTFDNLGPLTYEIWFKDVGSLESGGKRFFSKGSMIFWINFSGRIALTVNHSGTNLFKEASIGWALDTWHHFAVTWDGGLSENGVSIYDDGVDAGDTNRNDASGTQNNDASVDQFIGNTAGSGLARAPEAHLDEIRISRIARSPGWLLLSYRGAADTLFTYGAYERY